MAAEDDSWSTLLGRAPSGYVKADAIRLDALARVDVDSGNDALARSPDAVLRRPYVVRIVRVEVRAAAGKDHVELVLDAAATPQRTLEVLVQAGIPIDRFEVATPSLNEIFIAKVGGDACDADTE